MKETSVAAPVAVGQVTAVLGPDVAACKAAPAAELIERTFPAGVEAISVQQTTRGCLQECCGCEAKSEYKVYWGHVEEGQARKEDIPQAGHLLESSSCLARFCCGVSRAWTMPLTLGPPTGKGKQRVYGPRVLEFRKQFSFPLCCNFPSQYIGYAGKIPCVSLAIGGEIDVPGPIPFPCCCLLPTIETVDNDGNKLGETRYLCDRNLWVPKFGIFDGDGAFKYLLKPDTCCGGCCIYFKLCGASKRKSRMAYIPFSIRTPAGEKIPAAAQFGEDPDDAFAQINKVWSGLKKECCSDADNFQVIFPAGVDAKTKTLVGANVALDFVWFETQEGA